MARYATGIRNADGITIDSTGHNVYSTQQGRDQLGQNWPKFFTPEQGAYLPAEEVLRVVRGGNYGWPFRNRVMTSCSSLSQTARRRVIA